MLFLGDYIYEYAIAARTRSAASRAAVAATLDAVPRPLRHLQERPARCRRRTRAAPWLMVWDDHEVANDYADLQGQDLAVRLRARGAPPPTAPTGSTCRFRSRRGRVGADMRIVGRLDWGALARIHLLDDRQYRDPQACPKPGRGGSNTVALAQCPALVDPKRTPARRRAGALARRRLGPRRGPGTCSRQQTLMARFSWGDPAIGGGVYWTDGWDGYAPSRNRLLGVVAERRCRASSSSAATCTATTSPT